MNMTDTEQAVYVNDSSLCESMVVSCREFLLNANVIELPFSSNTQQVNPKYSPLYQLLSLTSQVISRFILTLSGGDFPSPEVCKQFLKVIIIIILSVYNNIDYFSLNH